MDPELESFLVVVAALAAISLGAYVTFRVLSRQFRAVSRPGANWPQAKATVEHISPGEGNTNGVFHTRVDLLVMPDLQPQYRTFTERALILKEGDLSVGQQVYVRIDPRHPEMVYLEDPY